MIVKSITLVEITKDFAERSAAPVAEQCAWAVGNVAGEGEQTRDILIAQGALLPLARLLFSNKSSLAKTAAWALSNLIKVRSCILYPNIDHIYKVISRHSCSI
jgi:hypothetical protein